MQSLSSIIQSAPAAGWYLRSLLSTRRRGVPANPANTHKQDRVNAETLADLPERRGAAMRQLFPKLSAWCASKLELARGREVHDYLSQAADVFDLEERIRRVERNGGVPPGF